MRRAGGSIISATVPVSPVSVVLVVGLFGEHCIVGESQLEAASCEPSVGGGVYRALLFKGQCAACTSHRRQSSGVGVQMPPHSRVKWLPARVRSKREAGRKPPLASNAHQESPTRSDGGGLRSPSSLKNEEILIVFHVSARPVCVLPVSLPSGELCNCYHGPAPGAL